jgi:hypothetical protein
MATSGERRRGDRTLDRLIDAGTHRWGTFAIPAAAAVAVIFGVGFLAAPDRYAAVPFYAYAFRLLSLGPRPIGVAHLLIAITVLIRPSRLSTVAILALNTVWAIISAAAVFQPGVSPTSFAYPVTFTLLLLISVLARGYDAATRR